MFHELSGANSFGSGTLTFGSGATADGYIQLANNTALGNYTTINEAGTGAGTCGLQVSGGGDLRLQHYDVRAEQ